MSNYYFTLGSCTGDHYPQDCPKELHRAIRHFARRHLATCKGIKPEAVKLEDFRIRVKFELWIEQKYLTPPPPITAKKVVVAKGKAK